MSKAKQSGGKRKVYGAVVRNGRRRYVFPPLPPGVAELRGKQNAEQERNDPVFDERLPELLKTLRGRWAVMKNGKIVGTYPTSDEAAAAGDRRYRCGVYSLHKIDDAVVNLGIFSCV